ncbi:MAG: DUF6029 family protein [Bacteroidota bacterium]
MTTKLISRLLLVFTFISSSILSIAQDLSKGEIHGNFESTVQSYKEDSLINAPAVSEKVLMNAFTNINYTNGNFAAGIRYESYLNPLLGFDPRYKGSGIAYKYATYKANELEITVGNYYEQFGSGLIFRSYEERGLGIDNAMNGLRLKYNPSKGIYLKGIIGKQRFFFDEGEGIIRGVDGDIDLNEAIPMFTNAKTKVIIGGSFVSKFQKDADPKYVLPENVASYGGRINLTCGKFGLLSEYAYKINDPSSANNFIYKPGEALLVTASFSQKKGLGLILSAKRTDNMSYHSSRTETGNALIMNYLPALTRQHVYTLSAMYPYASQANGEMAFQGDLMYKIQKGTLLGGKYGTSIAVNYSRANNIEKTQINDTILIDTKGTMGYKSDFFAIGKEKYFEDINVEISKKVSSKFKFLLSYLNQVYNKSVIQGNKSYGTVYSDIVILDMSYKIKPTHALRLELQHLSTKQDYGAWGMGLLEYTIAPKWFFTVMDQYNYGNKHVDKRIHYMNCAIGFTKNSNRFQLGYGKQREGIICVGGVCRNVPASNGFTLTITSSF